MRQIGFVQDIMTHVERESIIFAPSRETQSHCMRQRSPQTAKKRPFPEEIQRPQRIWLF